MTTTNKKVPKLGQLIKIIWEDLEEIETVLVIKITQFTGTRGRKLSPSIHVFRPDWKFKRQSIELDQILWFGPIVELKF